MVIKKERERDYIDSRARRVSRNSWNKEEQLLEHAIITFVSAGVSPCWAVLRFTLPWTATNAASRAPCVRGLVNFEFGGVL